MIKAKGDRVRIVVDDSRIERRLLDNPSVGLFMASEWARYMSKYVPMQSGILKSNYTVEPFLITYESPYAHYQWQGELYVDPITGSSFAREGTIKVPTGIPLQYSKEQNPLATSHWEVPTEKAFGNNVARAVSEFIRRL